MRIIQPPNPSPTPLALSNAKKKSSIRASAMRDKIRKDELIESIIDESFPQGALKITLDEFLQTG